MTGIADLQPSVEAEFLALARILDSISDQQWETPSLCEGWAVREVVAHVTMAARYTEDEFMAKLREYSFDFTLLSNAIAKQDAALPSATLVADLRSDVMHHWTSPEGGYLGALIHVVIHGLDVTVPLGIASRVPEGAIRTVLDELTSGGTHGHFGIDLSGRALRATDIDWTYGSGAVLRGSAEDLALVVCGRSLPAGRLDGRPLSRAL